MSLFCSGLALGLVLKGLLYSNRQKERGVTSGCDRFFTLQRREASC